MGKEEIRKKYVRHGGIQGKNEMAVERLINMVEEQKSCSNTYIRNIAENFDALEKRMPNFIIFESEKENNTFFMPTFNALQIDTSNNDIVLAHEYGHAVLKAFNETALPDDFNNILARAKQHALLPENKEKFMKYIEYLTDDTKQERTEEEKGPVSDIISSVFQFPALTFAKDGIKHVLPSFHDRSYYYDEENKEPKYNKIFDEQFANFYSLTAHERENELNTLRQLFGNEFMQTMEKQLELASNRADLSKETEEKDIIPKEKIASVIMNVTKSQIDSVRNIENELENKTKENDELTKE